MKFQSAENGKNSDSKYSRDSSPGMVCFGEYASYQFNCKFCDFLHECRETTIAKKGKSK